MGYKVVYASQEWRAAGILAGLGLIIAGAIVQTQLHSYVDFFGHTFSAAAIFLIVIGALIFVIGFFGCCGAYKEQYCMIMTFAVLLAVVFLFEIAVAVAAYIMRSSIKTHVDTEMTSAAAKYNVSGHEGVTKTWDVVQHDFKCCGVRNYTSWARLSPDVPDSCCEVEFVGCGLNAYEHYDDRFFDKGCVHKMEVKANENVLVIGGVVLGLACVQIIGILLACCLARSIKSEYRMVV